MGTFVVLHLIAKTSFISILYPDYNYKLKMYLKPHNTPPTTITFRFVHFWMCFFIYSFFKAKTTDTNFNRKKKNLSTHPLLKLSRKLERNLEKKPRKQHLLLWKYKIFLNLVSSANERKKRHFSCY